MKLALTETPKTGFLTTRPIWLMQLQRLKMLRLTVEEEMHLIANTLFNL